MDPADLGIAAEEEWLAQLWDYCRSVIYDADNYKRHLQVVVFDVIHCLFMSFLDIKK